MSQTQTFQFERKGFWTVGLTLFIMAYNVSVIPAIMPAIVADFNTSVGSIQTILVLFSLITASFALVWMLKRSPCHSIHSELHSR